MTVIDLFEQLEKKFDTNQTGAAKIIGVAQSRYSQYRSGKRRLPLYIKKSIVAHCKIVIDLYK